ncbi:MAG: DNA-processing protein DprA [Candidatus Marinamargulisbacteria bacterium]
MPIKFILQSLLFDRPRLLAQFAATIQSEKDMQDVVLNLPATDPFRRILVKRLALLSNQYDQLSALNITWVDDDHPLYPAGFRQLTDPPLGVFMHGVLPASLSGAVAIVGTRRPSLLAASRVASLVQSLKGMVVVSGGALGIDAMAHQQALNQSYKTVAVLASGLDKMTPITNQGLFEQMIESGLGAVITECPPGTVPKPYYFPQRNRLIAAMTSKVIVVEAAKRSGAVLTANIAAGLGRDVAAVVGGYNAPQSEGCYELMNDGAFAIGNADQLAHFLGIQPLLGCAQPMQDDDLLAQIPAEPISIESLATQLDMSLTELIEEVTQMSLNGDVIISAGQQVHRCE